MTQKPNNQRVYLDNAATTPMDDRVIDAMTDTLKSCFGNPSATHSLGRNAKGVLENARKQIAAHIGASSKEIVFTSGGTEADNLAIRCAVRDLGVKNIITSPIEHMAVLGTSQELEMQGLVKVHLVNIDNQGRVDYTDLEALAGQFPGSLITLMHANNELGTLLDYQRVSRIAKEHSCYFHSDTVQTMGHYKIDVNDFQADFLTCSAHKFNGPKGVGFLYINSALRIKALITGGGQERSLRAGTENVPGIVGLQKAMEIALSHVEEERRQILDIKSYMIGRLSEEIEDINFNGDLSEDGSLYTVLNVSLPPTSQNELILFQLDMAGVCASGGSACNSGATAGSHVLQGIKHPDNRQALRFSFGRFTSKSDVDFGINALKSVLEPVMVSA